MPRQPPQAYLRLRQAQPAGQLLPLRPDHVVVLLEGPFQAQQLRGRERRPDAFGFPGERAVQEQVLRAVVLPWKPRTNTLLLPQKNLFRLLPPGV